MKKSLILVLFMSMFLVLAGCGNKTEIVDVNENLDGEEIVVDNSETAGEEFESTMKEIYKKGGKVTCTMTTNEEGTEMNSTIYIDGDKTRTDAKGNVGGMQVSISSITKDGYTYTRNENEKEGWKMIDEDDVDYNDENDMDYDDEDMDNIKLKCKKGINDRGVFDLPAGVTFNEMPNFDF